MGIKWLFSDLSCPKPSYINVGDKVQVNINTDSFRQLNKEFGGWNDEMEKVCTYHLFSFITWNIFFIFYYLFLLSIFIINCASCKIHMKRATHEFHVELYVSFTWATIACVVCCILPYCRLLEKLEWSRKWFPATSWVWCLAVEDRGSSTDRLVRRWYITNISVVEFIGRKWKSMQNSVEWFHLIKKILDDWWIGYYWNCMKYKIYII